MNGVLNYLLQPFENIQHRLIVSQRLCLCLLQKYLGQCKQNAGLLENRISELSAVKSGEQVAPLKIIMEVVPHPERATVRVAKVFPGEGDHVP